MAPLIDLRRRAEQLDMVKDAQGWSTHEGDVVQMHDTTLHWLTSRRARCSYYVWKSTQAPPFVLLTSQEKHA